MPSPSLHLGEKALAYFTSEQVESDDDDVVVVRVLVVMEMVGMVVLVLGQQMANLPVVRGRCSARPGGRVKSWPLKHTTTTATTTAVSPQHLPIEYPEKKN